VTSLRIFASRLRGLFRRQASDRDLRDELAFHLDLETAENIRRGMTAADARTAALRRLGGVAQIQETYRETRGLPMIETLWQDVRYGVRVLRRSPGFTTVAVLCLTLGIGANAAVFSWIEGILLRPYPLVAHQERLMAVTSTDRGTPGHDDVSWPDFQDFARACTGFDAFIVDRITGVTLAIGDRAERSPATVVSSNYFDALGVRPVLGRGFLPAEDIGRNAHPVTVISYRTWQDRYRGDPSIIGKTQMLNGVRHTIVGVAPEGFYGTFVGYSIAFWAPLSMQELFDPGGYKLEDRGARWIEGVVRLKPGVSPAQAQAEISAVAQRLEAAYPATNRGRGIRLYPLWQTPFNGAGTMFPTLAIALAVSAFILLIVCANVSNLLLVRSFGRRREITIRLAIGSARRRIVQQLFTEGLLLSSLAAAGGFFAAYSCRNLFFVLIPARGGITPFLPGDIDWRVFLLSSAICLASTLLFGLVPALQTGNIDLAGSLKSESGGVVGSGSRAMVRSALVVVQVALSFVLLVGAGLLFQSLRAVRNTSPGFSTHGVLTTWVDLAAAGYTQPRIKSFDDDMIDRLRAVSGVESAAFLRTVPFSYRSYSSAPIAVEGYEAAPDQQLNVDYNEVGPAYFATAGIPLVSGREFTRADNETAPPVAVVNDAMASQFWRGQDSVGRRFQSKGQWLQIVGVARMSKYRNLTEIARPFFYVPMRQSSMGMNLIVRTALPPDTIAALLRREVQKLDANLAPGEIITMQEQVDRTTATQRLSVSMLAVFGSLALVLAAVGLYGVMQYSVSQRRREIGLRMALGADAAALLRRVLGQGLALTAAGIAVGVLAALAVTRLASGLLYNVSPRDPVAFAMAFLVMSAAALAACVVPAWRAARIDPVRALGTD
jgi:predicted permease